MSKWLYHEASMLLDGVMIGEDGSGRTGKARCGQDNKLEQLWSMR
jgi:hypothetical protein